jgi:hypothetical protein
VTPERLAEIRAYIGTDEDARYRGKASEMIADCLAALDAANADAARLAASVAVIPRGESITGMVEIEAALALAAHRARIETQP